MTQLNDPRDAMESSLKGLENHSLLRRFAESRKAMKDDPYRPKYHYVNPLGKLNDPNGLCRWRGLWHLFYQAYPPENPCQHWGHAVSSDLIHWRDLPYAIAPGPEHCCFSGSTLVEQDRVIAMYHGTRAGNMVAIADDPLLLDWEKLTGGPVIPILRDNAPDARWRAPDGSKRPFHIFDPCIWEKDGVYYSLSGGRLSEGPGGAPLRANFLFCSDDLIHWDYLHPFVEGDRFTLLGDDGACPYFWPIGERHILLFFSHRSGGQALLGDYDTVRDKLDVTSHHRFNFGAAWPGGVHAPSATPDGEGGVNVIFNMNCAMPTTGWNQIMSLPRNLRLAGGDELSITPAGDVESLRTDHRRLDNVPLPANREIVLEGVEGNAMEIIAEIDDNDSPMVEMNVLRSPGREEFTRIAFFRKRGYGSIQSPFPPGHYGILSIDSSHSSLHPDVLSRAPESAPVRLEDDEPLILRVFIDRSVIEVFVNGKQCVALRVYPARADSTGVSIRSQGREAVLKRLDAWQMEDIYETAAAGS